MEIKKRILLVEDDKSMGYLLKDTLETHGYKVSHCLDGQQALTEFNRKPFDLCLLDVMMPNMDGFTLAAEIRKTSQDIPIIFLTAKALKDDRIKGFKLGADDYVTKPFSIEELALRIKAILRRGKLLPSTNPIIPFSTCTLDHTNLVLDTATQKIQLTQKEADILALFATNPNVLLKREQILQAVWQDDGYFVGRSLDVFISKLRKHLKGNDSVKIVNVHGSGYRFQVGE